MIWRCDLVPQYMAYKKEIHEAINRVLGSGRYILASEVAAFEREFASYIGVEYGIGVNSGTDALILALSMCDIREGDEVITTPFTAIPTYAAIRHAGAKPVFVDIEPDTFLLDLAKVKDAITPRTKAVVPVHLFGNAVDIELLRKIVGRDIFIVEDCAQAHGAEVRGGKAGSLGDFGVFSFYPTKNLGGYGDGGIITTNDSEAADILRKKRVYGMISKDEFIFDGVNSRLDELQAAILRVKLRHLDRMNKRRSELADLYRRHLPEECIRPQVVRRGVKSVHHVYCALCIKLRDELLVFLEKNDIQANVYYPKPLYKQDGYRKVYRKEYNLPVVEEVSKRIIALPFYPEMSEEVLLSVTEKITEFYGEK
ncbi:MAG TPA: DegT/DnrJ/EryC1/StrS family aminotransferase [archaeon]|nr:DegT/DnrJ/EryC1/StrS family aminotransferase [archaeon]